VQQAVALVVPVRREEVRRMHAPGGTTRRSVLALVVSVAFVAALLAGARWWNAGSGQNAPALGSVPQLRVEGHRLVDDTGTPVLLRGFNTSGTEYACVEGWGIFDLPGADPVHVPEAVIERMAEWRGANAVRVPLNEQCWLGLGVPEAYGGAAYQGAVADYVRKLHAHGFVVVLDLHRSAPADARSTHQEQMPDRDHSLEFWRQVASAYGHDRAVVFDLFNEPWPFAEADTDRAWECWRDGGCELTSENDGQAYIAAGMNELVAAVRSTGAENVLAVGGIHWAEVLDRWLQYRPSDPRDNLMAAFHAYAFNEVCGDQGCYDDVLSRVAAEVPLFAGELGPDSLTTPGEPCQPGAEGRRGFADEVLDWLDDHGAGFTAWTWNAWGNCTALVADDEGTPTPTWGRQMRSRLAEDPPTG
jgi:endoglucanase